MKQDLITVNLEYHALLRERRGCSRETVQTSARNPLDLYKELCEKHTLDIPAQKLKVGINLEMRSWDTPLQDGDEVIFIPPVAGG